MGIATWFAATLRQYPEIAIFLALALGYYFGKFTFRGIGLGSVTATLLAGVLIGQLGITISQPLKAFVFLMFLFAVGYGVGPQFIRGIAKDGVPQALFAVVLCVLCLGSLVVIVKLAGYDLGYAAGLYSGSQTISAAMGLSTDAINRLGLPADARFHACRLCRQLHVRHHGLSHHYCAGWSRIAWYQSS
jgi:putative transport protein